MQYFVDLNKATQVFNTAPTLQVLTYELDGHFIRIETFDYGLNMGWVASGRVRQGHNDIRARAFLDNVRLPQFEATIRYRNRPNWLPKGITISKWNDALSQHAKGVWV